MAKQIKSCIERQNGCRLNGGDEVTSSVVESVRRAWIRSLMGKAPAFEAGEWGFETSRVFHCLSGLFNGKTAVSESANAGSIPAPGTDEWMKEKIK